MEDTLVTIATFEYYQFAHLAKAKLESEGINCCINDEYTASMNWLYSNAIGGIKLQVLSSDVDKAKEVLEENVMIGDGDAVQEIELEKDEEETIRCPYCKSAATIDEKYSKKWAYLSILLLGFPLLFKKRKYLCKECGYKWKKGEKD
jgi:DNA-directed RNA polymerase subunit RPC12/RpoP